MTYQPRHRPNILRVWLAECTVDFWRHEYKHYSLDVPGPGAKPIKTTPGPGHQAEAEIGIGEYTYDTTTRRPAKKSRT